MGKVIILLVASLALACGAPSAPAAETPLQTIEKHANEFQKTISEQFNSLANSKNTKEVEKALKEGSDKVMQQLSAFSATLQSAFADANDKVKAAAEQTRAQLQRTAEELRKAHPEVEQRADALKNALRDALSKTAEESKSLAKTVAENMEKTNAELAPKLKQAYEDFARQAEQVQRTISEAANKKH